MILITVDLTPGLYSNITAAFQKATSSKTIQIRMFSKTPEESEHTTLNQIDDTDDCTTREYWSGCRTP